MGEDATPNPQQRHSGPAAERPDRTQCRTRDWLTESIAAPPRAKRAEPDVQPDADAPNPADIPRWSRRVGEAALFVGRGFDALLGRVIEPPEKKSVAAAGAGKWRDTPKGVHVLHGFRWHWDALCLLLVHFGSFVPVFVVGYGALILFSLCFLWGDIPWSGVLFPVSLGLFFSVGGFTFAHAIQNIRQGRADGGALVLPSKPHVPPLLVFALCLAPLWRYAPSLLDDALLRLTPWGPDSFRLACIVGLCFYLMLGGHFVASAFALGDNEGLAGLGRSCWAGLKNAGAFLLCSLPIPLYLVLAWSMISGFGETFRDDPHRSARRLQLLLQMLVAGPTLGFIPLLAYAAARDIFYEESLPAEGV